ncbi:MAG: hypothetical protein KF851_12080 [Pirellulaceae bacterium]|nr:hypothetical protein [Pirellulaceae bacterium]
MESTQLQSRYAKGAFTERFAVVRLDGQPTRAQARYFVLDYSGADPHAVAAMEAYATSVEKENPELAASIRQALSDPSKGPAQHPCADSKQL